MNQRNRDCHQKLFAFAKERQIIQTSTCAFASSQIQSAGDIVSQGTNASSFDLAEVCVDRVAANLTQQKMSRVLAIFAHTESQNQPCLTSVTCLRDGEVFVNDPSRCDRHHANISTNCSQSGDAPGWRPVGEIHNRNLTVTSTKTIHFLVGQSAKC
jgi:hypothetical protein